MYCQNYKFFKNFNLQIISILVLILPITIVSGPFIPDLIISFSSSLFLVYCFKKNNYQIFKENLFYYFVVFYLILLISSFLSIDIYKSLKSVFFYFRFIIFSFLIYYIFVHSKNFVEKFFKLIFLFFVFLIIDAFIQFFYGSNLFGFHILNQNNYFRVTSVFGDDLKLGSYMARFFPFFIYSLIIINLKKLNFCKTPLIVSFITVILLSGERTAFFLSILSLIYLALFLKEKYIKKHLFLSIAILVITTLITFHLNENLKSRIILQTHEQIFNEDRSEEQKPILEKNRKFMFFSYMHDQHYRTALKIFRDYPIFGSGPKTFRILCAKKEYSSGINSCTTHPHNTYIQLLSESGILSFFVIISIFLYFVIKSGNQFFFKKEFFVNNLQVCMTCCFLVNLWPLSPSGSFFNNWLSIIYFFPVGVYLFSKTNEKVL